MTKIFISHAWKYDKHYWTVYNWIKEKLNIADYSIPEHDNCGDELSDKKLKECIDEQIRQSQIVIILSGMYVSYSDWIQYEIEKAYEMGKYIIGVKPWGNERLPQIVQDKADVIVGWNKDSIINAIKYYKRGLK